MLLFEAAVSPGFFPSLTGAIAIAQSLAAARVHAGRHECERSASKRTESAALLRPPNMFAGRKVRRHERPARAACCTEACARPPPKADRGRRHMADSRRRPPRARRLRGEQRFSCLGAPGIRELSTRDGEAGRRNSSIAIQVSFRPRPRPEAARRSSRRRRARRTGLRLFSVSGGSEAIEASIKLARQYFVERGGAASGSASSRRRPRAITAQHVGSSRPRVATRGRREPYSPLLVVRFSAM